MSIKNRLVNHQGQILVLATDKPDQNSDGGAFQAIALGFDGNRYLVEWNPSQEDANVPDENTYKVTLVPHPMETAKGVERAVRLRLARHAADLTQEQLAKAVDWSQEDIHRYERGHAAPPAEFLGRASEHLKVTPGWSRSA